MRVYCLTTGVTLSRFDVTNCSRVWLCNFNFNHLSDSSNGTLQVLLLHISRKRILCCRLQCLLGFQELLHCSMGRNHSVQRSVPFTQHTIPRVPLDIQAPSGPVSSVLVTRTLKHSKFPQAMCCYTLAISAYSVNMTS